MVSFLDGNVLFDSQITSDGGYLILGYGEGHFFVTQYIENFDVNEWQYGTIDKNGNILNEMKVFSFAPDTNDEVEYIRENYIKFDRENSRYKFYNLSTAELVSPDSNFQPITKFYEGYALCEASPMDMAIE